MIASNDELFFFFFFLSLNKTKDEPNGEILTHRSREMKKHKSKSIFRKHLEMKQIENKKKKIRDKNKSVQ